jgi:3-(3-hydroxy-phenyl)propionate hydroxylase
VTAANLLGQLGLRVLVVERDADVYASARAISTDEEVLRIWQRIGLADQLTAYMLADRAITFVDANGRGFLSFTPQTWGNGHPTQQFIYQPALEQTLRAGVDRYPNVEVLLGHECTGLDQDTDGADLTIRRTGAGDNARQARAAYVIAADGGSSPTRGRLNVSFEGRTYDDRWVVIDTKVTKPWPEVDRLRFHCNPARPAVDCPTPLGHHRWEFPVLPGDDPDALVTPEAVLELLAGQGIGPEHVKGCARSSTTTTSASPTAGGSGGCSWQATPRTSCRHGSGRAWPRACATWTTGAGSSPPPSTAASPPIWSSGCSTPTKPSGNRTCGPSPKPRCFSAGSSPSAARR